MKDRCSNCYFGDKCYCQDACDDYAPICEKDDYDKMIECGRAEFVDEWHEYISEYSD